MIFKSMPLRNYNTLNLQTVQTANHANHKIQKIRQELPLVRQKVQDKVSLIDKMEQQKERQARINKV